MAPNPGPVNFDWSDLRAFLAVARTGRLTAAALRLGADHTTVSRRIARLEEALRARLFERRPAGYSLTTQGERLLHAAEAMESIAIAAQNDIANTGLSVSGAVRIGATEGFGSYFLAPRIGELCRRHPELEVQLVAMPTRFSLSKREADIAISLTRPQEGRLVARRLTDYHLRVYAAAGYLESHPPIERREDLLRHAFIGYIDDLIYTPELDYLEAVGPIAPQVKSSNLIAQLRATVAGTGLCILPSFIAATEPTLVPVLADEITLTRSFWLIVHEDLHPLARITTTAEFIAEVVRRERGVFLPEG